MITVNDMIVILLLGFFCSLAGTWMSIKLAHLWAVHSQAHDRSLHEGRIPRLAGLGLFAGWIVSLSVAGAILQDPRLWIALACMVLLLSAGLYDDWRSATGHDNDPTSSLLKFLSQVAAACLAAGFCYRVEGFQIFGPISIEIGPVTGFFFTVLWIVALTNFFNFMDGSNGMAGGTAIIMSMFLFYWTQNPSMQWASLLVMALGVSVLAFMPFNFPSPRTFMGDGGALVIGFVLALAALPASQGLVPRHLNPWQAALIWSPFILDAGITVIRRLLRGDNIFKAHSSHFYQSIIKHGHSHVSVALLYWNLAVFFNLIAYRLFR
ncbi:MAG: MraY family glycosyltransferase [Verrucomicrobiae bacterium]|nr:MraY family glycosyltransferase [Verrucomicrobiae bacterium]